MSVVKASRRNPLVGVRLLLVEDDFLIAQSIKRMLERFGCIVVGPVPSVAEGERLARSGEVHGGVLDINIKGGTSSGIARTFERRGAPYFFITGYSSPPLEDQDLLSRRRLSKPVSEQALRAALLEEFFGSN